MKYTLLAISVVLLSIGNLSAATEPTAQPTAMLFNGGTPFNFVLSFTTSASAEGYIIYKSKRPITDAPTDGTTYEKGQGQSSSKVFYVGANNIHNVRDVQEATKYYFKVFAYNGSGAGINYLQTNPLYDSVTSVAANEGTYYQNINSGSASFIADLTALTSNHTFVAYSAYKSNIIPAIFERDTVGGKSVVNCEYSNETTIYTSPFDFVVSDYSREHVICKSWMHTFSTFGSGITSQPEGADYFNLLLTKQNSVNQVRSNDALGIPINSIQNYKEFTFGFDASNNKVFEPRADRRGDAARAMFYEMVTYNGKDGNWGLENLLSFAGNQDQNILKLWNQQDPPDNFERTKNEYIFTLQRNRNPFIDHPEWAACINFDSLVKSSACPTTSIADNFSTIELNVYPNPANLVLNIELAIVGFNSANISVFDVYGRKIFSSVTETTFTSLNTSNFENGNYLLHIETEGKSTFRKFIILN